IAALRHQNRSGPAGALAFRTSRKFGGHRSASSAADEDWEGPNFLLAGPATLRKCQARRPRGESDASDQKRRRPDKDDAIQHERLTNEEPAEIGCHCAFASES